MAGLISELNPPYLVKRDIFEVICTKTEKGEEKRPLIMAIIIFFGIHDCAH